MDINVITVFRQKIGNDSYHFDLQAVTKELKSYTVGYIVINKKTGMYQCNTSIYMQSIKHDMNALISNVNELIATLEETISQ